MGNDIYRRYASGGLLTLAGIAVVAALAYFGASGLANPAADLAHVHPATTDPFFSNLLKAYTPRRVCMYHELPVIWLHLVSDFLIGAAYFSIPVALIFFVRKRSDVQFHGLFWMFAMFILLCGTTHFISVWNLWQPLYRIDGLVKAATALVSVATAIALWPLIPRALALPSPAQLERRVEERTTELVAANRRLQQEVAAREAAEAEREQLLVREKAARRTAEDASRVKDEFLATISHELRTPLHSMLMWSQMLQRNALPEDTEREGLAVIERCVRLQSQLVDDLLDSSRIQTGKLQLAIEDVSLAGVLRDALATVQPAAAARGVAVEQRLEADPVVQGDRTRLQQILWNLLSNAVKFTSAGGRVEVTLRQQGSSVEVVVRDDGEGIEPGFIAHVFEPFRQADGSTTRRHGGLGLGLSIAQSLAQAHGGGITAGSEGLGRGATFLLTLPAKA